ncbi:MAG: response regulator [Scytonema sp. PMC 1069.18]|nr:response regulator [Scytonema sp. PMC 1069.18]MEC4884671.1 response regulator [Scytonema sp. PMC 1070.18]
MQPGSPKFANLAKGLATLTEERATGKLILSSDNQQWYLYLLLGRLLYATGGTHRVRRWYRAIKQECPHYQFEAHDQNLNEDEWEYQLLKLGIQQKHMTLSQAKNIIVAITQEVLFELVNSSGLESVWLTQKTYPIALLDVKPSLQAALALKNRWRNMGLEQLSPNAVPIVKQPYFENFRVSKNFFGIVQLVNGENTIWDIAAQLKQNVTTVGHHVEQLVTEKVLELSTISDLPSPTKAAFFSRLTKDYSEFLTSKDNQQTLRSQISPSSDTQPPSTQLLKTLEETADNSSSGNSGKNTLSAIEDSYRHTACTETTPVSLLQNTHTLELAVDNKTLSSSKISDKRNGSQQRDGGLASLNLTPENASDYNGGNPWNALAPPHPFNTSLIAPPTDQVEPQSTSPLITYVDDSYSDSMKMSHILKQAGYRFVSVREAIAALPILLESKPSLIFLDLVMPIANGYEICAQIRRVSALKNTPVIILTSNDGIVDRVRAKMAGSSGFLAKPITEEKVLRILAKYLPFHNS